MYVSLMYGGWCCRVAAGSESKLHEAEVEQGNDCNDSKQQRVEVIRDRSTSITQDD